jgi:hypothetical protein
MDLCGRLAKFQIVHLRSKHFPDTSDKMTIRCKRPTRKELTEFIDDPIQFFY